MYSATEIELLEEHIEILEKAAVAAESAANAEQQRRHAAERARNVAETAAKAEQEERRKVENELAKAEQEISELKSLLKDMTAAITMREAETRPPEEASGEETLGFKVGDEAREAEQPEGDDFPDNCTLVPDPSVSSYPHYAPSMHGTRDKDRIAHLEDENRVFIVSHAKYRPLLRVWIWMLAPTIPSRTPYNSTLSSEWECNASKVRIRDKTFLHFDQVYNDCEAVSQYVFRQMKPDVVTAIHGTYATIYYAYGSHRSGEMLTLVRGTPDQPSLLELCAQYAFERQRTVYMVCIEQIDGTFYDLGTDGKKQDIGKDLGDRSEPMGKRCASSTHKCAATVTDRLHLAESKRDPNGHAWYQIKFSLKGEPIDPTSGTLWFVDLAGVRTELPSQDRLSVPVGKPQHVKKRPLFYAVADLLPSLRLEKGNELIFQGITHQIETEKFYRKYLGRKETLTYSAIVIGHIRWQENSKERGEAILGLLKAWREKTIQAATTTTSTHYRSFIEGPTGFHVPPTELKVPGTGPSDAQSLNTEAKEEVKDPGRDSQPTSLPTDQNTAQATLKHTSRKLEPNIQTAVNRIEDQEA